MNIARDVIGCEIFYNDDDDPYVGTIQVEYTDLPCDELGFFIKSEKDDLYVYVTFELWKKLYEMAMKEIDLKVTYNCSNQNVIKDEG